ncbi:hypothetical protein EalM132_00087 [Exiguobacterium phage vB_EalM-132]|nr:hypothetical protein EalM132_00087 [Exiguobacterium phage vB_EalM-132]
MPKMEQHASGGLVFKPTPEEKAVRELKHTLGVLIEEFTIELERVKELRSELENIVKEKGE